MKIEDYIRDVKDFPKKWIVFKDISPLLASPEAFTEAIKKMAHNISDTHVIVWLDARWFIFWTAIAQYLELPFVMVRKAWKLPYTTFSESYALEYWENTFEIHIDAIEKNQKVTIIDDLLATWWSAYAAWKLIEKAWWEVESIQTLIELSFLEWREKLQSYKVEALISY